MAPGGRGANRQRPGRTSDNAGWFPMRAGFNLGLPVRATRAQSSSTPFPRLFSRNAAAQAIVTPLSDTYPLYDRISRPPEGRFCHGIAKRNNRSRSTKEVSQ